ncbi:MAG TPA: VCBS repeat-containing protein [Gammaproteobacteria bacterium]|jgi:hypothetical protein
MLGARFSLYTAATIFIVILISGCATTPTQGSRGLTGSGPAGGVISATSGVENGEAYFYFQVEVPPGREDSRPNFDVKYSNQAGDGPLGIGWYLDIPDSIFRCPATLATDGYTAGVSYAKTDRLCLNNSRLVVTSGSYGRSGSTYQTEIFNGDEATLVGDINSLTSYFVVSYEDGGKSYFKLVDQLPGSAAPVTWHVSRYIDIYGDTVDYLYDSSVPGETLLSEIRYSGKDAGGVEEKGTRFVRFSYEARPDVKVSFRAGGEHRETRRLSSIVVGMDTAGSAAPAREVKEYDFSYIQSHATGRSLLSSVRECLTGDDSAKQCIAPTTFTWSNDILTFKDPVRYGTPELETGLKTSQLTDATSIMRSPYLVLGDFDGDGRRELLYYRPGVGAHLYFMNPDATLRKDVDVSKFFQSPPEILFHSSVVDIDNDGASDLPGNSNGHLAFASWHGADMGTPVETDIPYSTEMALGYFSGGRQPDVLQVEPMKPGADEAGLFLISQRGFAPWRIAFRTASAGVRAQATEVWRSGGA